MCDILTMHNWLECLDRYIHYTSYWCHLGTGVEVNLAYVCKELEHTRLIVSNSHVTQPAHNTYYQGFMLWLVDAKKPWYVREGGTILVSKPASHRL
jgi:hypothetical protein